jgi:SAM-dependent methyltransferase
MSFAKTTEAIARLHPEMKLGGYAAYDGTVEFYGRIKALITPDMRVLDLGAGRGAWFEEEDSEYRRELRLLRGHVAEVIGCDIDEAVLKNNAVDRSVVIRAGEPWPLAADSVNLIVADYVFEHIQDPQSFAAEVNRVLKVGGWLCARTPTKYNYISLMAGLVRNIHHARVLSRVQPGRKAEDVFPTYFRLNTRSAIRHVFDARRFEDCSYLYSFEPQYHFGSAAFYRLLRVAHRVLPTALHGNLFAFLKRTAP